MSAGARGGPSAIPTLRSVASVTTSSSTSAFPNGTVVLGSSSFSKTSTIPVDLVITAEFSEASGAVVREIIPQDQNINGGFNVFSPQGSSSPTSSPSSPPPSLPTPPSTLSTASSLSSLSSSISLGKPFDLSAFVSRIMAVDYTPNSAGSSAAQRLAAHEEETPVVVSEPSHSVYSYVLHFFLHDVNARGFVRTVALAYITSEPGKIMAHYEDLHREATKVAATWKQGNAFVFAADLDAKLAALNTLKGKLVSLQKNDPDGTEPWLDHTPHKDIHSKRLAEQLEDLRKLRAAFLAANPAAFNKGSTSKLERAKSLLSSFGGSSSTSSLTPPKKSLPSPPSDPVGRKNNLPPPAAAPPPVSATGILQTLLGSAGASTTTSVAGSQGLGPKANAGDPPLPPPLTSSSATRASLASIPRAGASSKKPTSTSRLSRRTLGSTTFSPPNSLFKRPIAVLVGSEYFDLGFLRLQRVHQRFSKPAWILAMDEDAAAQSDASGPLTLAVGHSPVLSLVPDVGGKFGSSVVSGSGAERGGGAGGAGGGGKSTTRSRKKGFRLTSYTEQFLELSEHHVGKGILDFVRGFAWCGHLVASLLQGRPVIVHGPPAQEWKVRSYVNMFSLFVPGGHTHHSIVPWKTEALSLPDLTRYRLVGLSKSAAIPPQLSSYITLFNVDAGTLRAPEYKSGSIVAEILKPKSSWPDEDTFIAHVHEVLLSVGLSSSLYFHMGSVGVVPRSGPRVSTAGGSRRKGKNSKKRGNTTERRKMRAALVGAESGKDGGPSALSAAPVAVQIAESRSSSDGDMSPEERALRSESMAAAVSAFDMLEGGGFEGGSISLPSDRRNSKVDRAEATLAAAEGSWSAKTAGTLTLLPSIEPYSRMLSPSAVNHVKEARQDLTKAIAGLDGDGAQEGALLAAEVSGRVLDFLSIYGDDRPIVQSLVEDMKASAVTGGPLGAERGVTALMQSVRLKPAACKVFRRR